MWTRGTLIAALALGAPLGAGCLDELEQPGDREAMCEVPEDCDEAAGEVCDDGVCWGNPPDERRFAIVLGPPEGRDDLATTEIEDLDVADDGALPELEFEPAWELSGRVVLRCDDDALFEGCEDGISIPARVDVERPSRLPGGEPFSRTVRAEGGADDGEEAFTVDVPPRAEGDPPYELFVRPTTPEPEAYDAPETYESMELEALAPPLRAEIETDTVRGDRAVEIELGAPADYATLRGRVADATGQGAADWRVHARGNFAERDEAERVSTRARSDGEGAFALRIPVDVQGEVEIRARPPAGEPAPEVRLVDVDLAALAGGEEDGGETGEGDLLDPTEHIELPELSIPSYPSPTRFALPVEGKDPGGGSAPVEGADVALATELSAEPGQKAVYTAEAVTDEEGVAEFDLIPAGESNRLYRGDVHPPADAIHATLRGLEVKVGPGSDESTSVLASVSVPQRTLVDGRVVDAHGVAAGDARIEARPATSLLWSLPEAERERARARGVETVTADGSGRFDLWLDPELAGRAAAYDIDVIPPPRAYAPRWTAEGIQLDEQSSALELEDIELPSVANVRGVVRAEGEAVSGAEVRLYELGAGEELCQSEHAPGGEACEPPARLRGLERAGDDGSVWLHLPDGS